MLGISVTPPPSSTSQYPLLTAVYMYTTSAADPSDQTLTLTLTLVFMAMAGDSCIFSHKRRRPPLAAEPQVSPFDSLSEDILFLILDFSDPLDKKSFSRVSRSFRAVESRHRRVLTPLRPDLLPAALSRYPSASRLDLTLCPRITDAALSAAASALRSSLRSIDLSRSRSFSNVGLGNLAVTCGSLVEIDLSNGTDLDDAAAAALGRAGNLERLWMTRCRTVTDIGIGCIAVGCSKLRLLCLKWCFGVTDLGAGLVAVKCKEMRSLDLSYTQITKKCLPGILQLQYLEDLSIAGCVGIDDEGLVNLKHACKSLEVLNMSDCRPVRCAGYSSFLDGAIGLRQLTLAYCSPLAGSLFSSLQRHTKLQSIKLDGCQVTSSGLKDIGSSCTSLRELSLSKCSGVTDDGLSFAVQKQNNLVKLDITCCRNITDISLATITSSCTSLTSLRMESCSSVSNKGFIFIGRCRLLEELDLTENNLDDEGLKAISRCHSISSLKIGICLNINDEGLIHLARCCSKLQELDLYRSVGITDAGVTAIASGCPMLHAINLAYCNMVTDSSLKSLSKCSRLNTLEIRGCLQLSSDGLTAIALGCRQITRLDIKKCIQINDIGMLLLARFSQNLRQINLSYSSVTDMGLLALASISCLQNLTVLHLVGMTPNGLTAALLTCMGLTKVKLHLLFKFSISKSLLEHLESRGCMFHWRDKPIQFGDADEIWKQLGRYEFGMSNL